MYANQQGSVVALANGNGVTTGGQGYGPFGETGGTLASRFGYTGQQYLAPVGLYYYKARMYSPNLGRFLQTDPVGYADDLNLYAYVKNNPVNLTDPSGMIASLSGSFANASSAASANVAAQPATGGAKLDGAVIATPQSEVASAIVVAQRGRPKNGDPGSYYVHPLTGDGRRYGDDGKPLLDYDVSHSHGEMVPHIHIWRNGVRGTGESPF
ncbi:RHS repeat-associated protein [Paraburkholderia rhizosphaerae]|uniref:RHS repeat-associated protein n=2 Tax=Paraburkholderia rhizosphaerae TaxID=480658 RepID=A0A4R8LPS9_9BURK|nr:RHS repeat-associated protein [Paraburkholderia rhizosphaerae]